MLGLRFVSQFEGEQCEKVVQSGGSNVVQFSYIVREVGSIYTKKSHFKTMETTNRFEPNIVQNLCLVIIMELHME